jgi:ParB family chromosome partitioning protein
MAGGYSILNALNSSTRQQAEDKPGGRFRTKDININDIYPNGRNFYAMQDIEALAEDIKAVGLLENLTVMYAPETDGGRNYKLLGGERRWRALTLLVQQGNTEFAVATCQIRSAENERAEMIEIIMCNRQRVKTVWEQIEEERQLKETLQEMKANGEKLKGYDLQEGRLRDTVAAILKYSAAKVGQMETISNNLIPELQEALKAERINYSTAYTVAKMDEAGQRAALAAYEENGELNSKQAKEAAEPAQQEEPQELPEDYGADQMNVESICYRCAHWGDCYQKSETTVKCATFEDKNRQQETEPVQQEEQTEKPQEQPQPRVIDGSTGEVYENMDEAEKAVETPQEKPQEGQKERVHFIRLATQYFDDVAAGIKTFELRKNDRGYKTGDILEMNEFKDGRNTGRVIRCKVTYILEDYTGLTDGYCILATQVLEVCG